MEKEVRLRTVYKYSLGSRPNVVKEITVLRNPRIVHFSDMPIDSGMAVWVEGDSEYGKCYRMVLKWVGTGDTWSNDEWRWVKSTISGHYVWHLLHHESTVWRAFPWP